MMQLRYKLFVALVFACSFAIGQGYKPAPKDIGRLVNENKKYGTSSSDSFLRFKYSKENKARKSFHSSLPLFNERPAAITPAPGSVLNETVHPDFTMIHPGTYYEQLGFFCRKEIQLQRITTVPVKFRLGSYDYVNWLEGKDHRP